MGFFKPGWENKNIEKRQEAVAEVKSQELLLELAKTSMYRDVRKAAIERIEDEEALVHLTNNEWDEDVCLAIVGKLQDEQLLGRLIIGSKKYTVQKAAFAKIQDEEVMADIVLFAAPAGYMGRDDIRREAIGNIQDLALLRKIALEATDPLVQKWAKEKLPKDKEKEANEHAAIYAENWKERMEAVCRLKDQALLLEIALKDKDENVRLAATERLIDKQALTKVALNDLHRDVCQAAVSRITDGGLLLYIAQKAKSGYARAWAAKNTLATSELADYLKGDSQLKERLDVAQGFFRNTKAKHSEKAGVLSVMIGYANVLPESEKKETLKRIAVAVVPKKDREKFGLEVLEREPQTPDDEDNLYMVSVSYNGLRLL